MKDKIYFEKGEFFGLIGTPEWTPIDSFEEIVYNTALKACIITKKRIENPEAFNGNEWHPSLGDKVTILKDGDIFDLPEGLMFEEKRVRDELSKRPSYSIALRLVPKHEVKDESQDELWNEVYDICHSGVEDTKELKSKFTIKRNTK